MSKAEGIIRWGIIGCGEVTEMKSGPGFQKARGSALEMVMRRDHAKAEDYARRHNVPRWTSDAQELIEDANVDAIYIATPPYAHLQYCLAAAKAGKPVYVEKPCGRSLAECRAMIAGCQQAGTRFFSAYYRRAQERFIWMKQVLEQGAIGSLLSVELTHTQPAHPEDGIPGARWQVVPAMSGGGIFVDTGCHGVDTLDFLLGEMRNPRGQAENRAGLYEAEDYVEGEWNHPGGVLGRGHWNYAAHARSDLVRITGTDGWLEFSVFSPERTILHSGGETREMPFERPQHVEQPMIQAVVDELLGGSMAPSGAENALRAWQTMEALFGDYYK